MSTYKWDDGGNLLRAEQSPLYLPPRGIEELPRLALQPGDRFYDHAAGRWGLLIRILPREEALGAPFEALYDGCDRFAPFIATAMAHDIGEIVKCSD